MGKEIIVFGQLGIPRSCSDWEGDMLVFVGRIFPLENELLPPLQDESRNVLLF
jgi:hypothetical protein